MIRIEYVCGVGLNKAGENLGNVSERLSACRRILTMYHKAFTESDGAGFWEGAAEPVKVFVVFADVSTISAKQVARELARLLDQNCVAVSISECNFALVESGDLSGEGEDEEAESDPCEECTVPRWACPRGGCK